jgi:hypothetical protein
LRKVRVTRPAPAKGKADVGLSDLDRQLVHSLRNLLLPKGNGESTPKPRGKRNGKGSSEKNCVPPKGERSKPNEKPSLERSNPDWVSDKKAKQTTHKREKLVTVEVAGQMRSTRVSIPLGCGKAVKSRKVARAEELLRAGKWTEKTTVSPSRIARSERRREKQQAWLDNRSRDHKSKKDEKSSEKMEKSRADQAPATGKKAKKASYTVWTPKNGCELLAEKAFGGSRALFLLSTMRNFRKEEPYVLKEYMPEGHERRVRDHESGLPGYTAKETSIIKRDFKIAVKDLKLSSYSEKGSIGLGKASTGRAASRRDSRGVLPPNNGKKGSTLGKSPRNDSESQGKKIEVKGEPMDTKKPKNPSPSQLRRKEKRRSAMAERCTKAVQVNIVEPGLRASEKTPELAAPSKSAEFQDSESSLYESVDKILRCQKLLVEAECVRLRMLPRIRLQEEARAKEFKQRLLKSLELGDQLTRVPHAALIPDYEEY